jgi:hypothetical protein
VVLGLERTRHAGPWAQVSRWQAQQQQLVAFRTPGIDTAQVMRNAATSAVAAADPGAVSTQSARGGRAVVLGLERSRHAGPRAQVGV